MQDFPILIKQRSITNKAEILGVVSIFTGPLDIVLLVSDSLFQAIHRAIPLFRLYGLSGIVLLFFGSRTTWRVEAQILGKLDDKEALEFKKSVKDECTMISVAVRNFHCLSVDHDELTDLRLPLWRRLR